MPVRQVVLYSSGVGYFEHAGTVHGDGTAELRFAARQVNDVLKSLVLQDLDHGTVRAVTYPSQDPIAKTLKSFGVNLTANPPMAELLNQLRGAQVTVTVGADDTAGTVVGVETRTVVVRGNGGDRAVDQHVLNLLSRGKIVARPLEDVTAIQLDDPRLQAELTAALATLAGARDADKKPVTVRFSGDGDRRVRMGYVVETPVWKTSYRLVLGDRGPDGPTTRPAGGQLQGWAIVENQTDNDWTDVQLALVSGRPISFVEDLYQPLYVPRPVVEPDLFASLRPQTYAGGQEADGSPATRPAEPRPVGSTESGVTLDQLQKRMAARRQATQGQQASGGGGGGQSQSLFSGAGQAADPNAPPPPIDPTASVRSLASAATAGELFEFTVGRVSLARQRSAMIPIITDPVEVERVSIYNAAVLPRNPLNGARVKNTTGKLLLAGPITVLDGARYAGDAQVDDVPAGQERLLSYGVDLQMLVDATDDDDTSDQIVTGRIVKGVLLVSHRTRVGKRYVAQNKSAHAKQLIVEHPRQAAAQGGDWHLIESPVPTEQTDAVYRFRAAVPAGKSATVRVVEEQTADQQVQILQEQNPGVLEFYRQGGELPRPVQEALAKAIALKRAVVDTQRQLDTDKQKLTDLTNEQGRIRENLKSVQPKSTYYDRLMGKLNDQETVIEQTQAEADKLQKQADAQRQELETYLAGLDV